MPAVKLLNIFALSTLAVLLCSFAPSQTLAVSIRADHLARQLPNHHGIAKKKRAPKRCKPRSSTSPPKPTSSPKDDPPKNNDPPKNDTPKPSPTTTKPPTVVETKPPTNSPGGRGKLAIAWAMGEDKRFSLLAASKHVGWVHLWSPWIPTIVKNSGIPVSIMLWGPGQDKINEFVKLAKPGYASYAFGFNEVNQHDQGAVDVDTAVRIWHQYLRPLANQGYTLGGPVTTSAPNGFPWMTEFLQKCGGDCHMDDMAVHWYDVEFEDLKAYVNKWGGFKKPMRVTEFACQNFNGPNQPSMNHIWDFTTKAINFFEGNGQVLSYAPFGFMMDMYNVEPNNRLFHSSGGNNLSDLGWKYVNGN